MKDLQINKMYYVYRHRTETDNRVFYIGNGDKNRPFLKCKNKRSKEWLDIYENECLIVDILYETKDKEEALELESLLIQEYGRIIDGGTLVNKALYNNANGIKRSEETKQKIRDANIGSKNYNYGIKGDKHHNFGLKRSEETKQKISDSKKGQIPPNRRVILQYTKDGEFIKEWKSITEATKTLQYKSNSSISNAIKNNSITNGGFIWKYKV